MTDTCDRCGEAEAEAGAPACRDCLNVEAEHYEEQAERRLRDGLPEDDPYPGACARLAGDDAEVLAEHPACPACEAVEVGDAAGLARHLHIVHDWDFRRAVSAAVTEAHRARAARREVGDEIRDPAARRHARRSW